MENFMRRWITSWSILALVSVAFFAVSAAEQGINLSPAGWPKGEYEKFLMIQGADHDQSGVAAGRNGAVTVAYNGLAARAGLEALKQGGNAIDAAMTTALTQVALTAGAPISYFGIMSLVYCDAASGKVYTMNAEWNTIRGETDPTSIPGSIDMASEAGLRGTAVSGRTALVGGFLKGVGAAHARFGRLPFRHLFEPAIYIAENGVPVTEKLNEKFRFRGGDLKRLPETRAVFMKPDGTFPAPGEIFRQPALAKTLRAIAAQGTDYIYKGPWAKKLVAAVQADGGKMTLEDLAAYDVIWDEPLIAEVGDYRLYTNRPPNMGGVAMIEALNLGDVSGIVTDGPWSKSGVAFRKAMDIAQMLSLSYLPDSLVKQIYPGMDFSPLARTTRKHAVELWERMQKGAKPFRLAEGPKNSDDVVCIDKAGNIAAITHSINCVDWGRTAINIDGISIGDPGSFQQAQIAAVKPGGRLPAPTETGILFQGGKPVLGFASMGSGLHHRTFQCLFNVIKFGVTVDQAINAPDFFLPVMDTKTSMTTVRVPKGRFPEAVLKGMGYAYEEVEPAQARFAGEGLWTAISRDPKTGELRAASPNRNNSAAVAY
jgi:gamma-glutamyltranspeptidase / glutathione hydrolase